MKKIEIISNNVTEKKVSFEMDLLGGCTCTKEKNDPHCTGVFIMLDYELVCRHLELDPRQHKVFLSKGFSSIPCRLHVLFPWDMHRYTRDTVCTICNPIGGVQLDPECKHREPRNPVAKSKKAYGRRSDYESEDNPFGWIEHTKPVLSIPCHIWTPARFSIMQPMYVQYCK